MNKGQLIGSSGSPIPHNVKKCRECHRILGLDKFPPDRGGRTRNDCRICHGRKQRIKRLAQERINGTALPWDWASMLNKFKAMSGKRAQQSADRGMDAEMLRCLWEVQRGKCALSGYNMIIPVNCDPRTTISAWRDKLNCHDRAYSVDIVRPLPSRPWGPGNVILVCYMYGVIFDTVGNYSEFRNVCAKPLDVTCVVTPAPTILEVRGARIGQRRSELLYNENDEDTEHNEYDD